jgi:hypothetical protein
MKAEFFKKDRSSFNLVIAGPFLFSSAILPQTPIKSEESSA